LICVDGMGEHSQYRSSERVGEIRRTHLTTSEREIVHLFDRNHSIFVLLESVDEDEVVDQFYAFISDQDLDFGLT
jgi:hypothetical protein